MRGIFSIKIFAVLFLLLFLSGCNTSRKQTAAAVISTTAPTAETTAETQPNPIDLIEELALTVTEADIHQLLQYPNLKKVDLTGSTCYKAIQAFQRSHPEIEVFYTVSFGNAEFSPDSTGITIAAEDLEYDKLLANLGFLTHLKSLSLPDTNLSREQLEALREAYPEIAISFTVGILDTEYTSGTTELDLGFLTPDQISDVSAQLRLLPDLQYVELMSGSESKLSVADVKALVDAAPQANFHYVFSLFGKTISTTDETVEFNNLNLGNDREPELRAALDIMTGCKTFILDKCGMDNEVLAAIREDYPRTELVWRINFGKYNTLTNAETIRAVYHVYDDTCQNLKYCKDVKYMDIGHNEELTDLSFVAYMPDLEILIASGCAVKDLTGFENCKKLEFLELAYCNFITDITPLSGCTGLKNLNICYTKVSSLLPLDGLPLERLFCKQANVPAKEQKVFQEIHPDCIVRFTGKDPYAGSGWRYIDEGKTYTEIYKKVREVFGYDDLPG